MRIFLKAALAAMCIAVASCSASDISRTTSLQDSAHLFSIHDVAILMPYVDRPEFIEKGLRLSSKSKTENSIFVPSSVFATLDRSMLEDDLMRQSEGERFGAGASNRGFESIFFTRKADEFRLASVRIDPCANSIEAERNPTACERELRLVWSQIIHTPENTAFATDANIHGIYHLTEESLDELLSEILIIKQESGVDYDQKPLGPHPLLLDPANGEKHLSRFNHLVQTYAKQEHLKSIAGLGDTAPMFEGHWPMLMIDKQNNEWLPRPLEHVVKTNEAHLAQVRIERDDGSIDWVERMVTENPKTVQRLGGMQGLLSKASPLGTIDEEFFALWRPSKNRDESLKLSLAYLQSLNARLDPVNTHIGNTDCASCHTIDSQMEFRKYQLGDQWPGTPSPWSESKWNLSKTDDLSTDATSLQMFSFFREKYAIQQRTIHEAALSADRINLRFQLGNL